eukprot:GHVT01100951.1.p2 GENE.GHVT01100951.1~~GHVT01100951.1.p2  ORF type:complete len:113 (-),score=3.94 GHVT01100951.1:673-1011(-)
MQSKCHKAERKPHTRTIRLAVYFFAKILMQVLNTLLPAAELLYLLGSAPTSRSSRRRRSSSSTNCNSGSSYSGSSVSCSGGNRWRDTERVAALQYVSLLPNEIVSVKIVVES